MATMTAKPKTERVATDCGTICFTLKTGESYTVPVRYTRDGGDRIVPLIGDMARAMYEMSILEARRANGEQDVPSRPLSLGFMERQTLGTFHRAKEWIERLVTPVSGQGRQ